MSLLETKPWLWIALLLALVVALASCARTPRPDEGASSGTSSGAASSSPLAASEAPAPIDREALKARLTPMQWKVTQESGTERAYTGEYWDNHADGIYVDIVDGTPLFSSKDKFDSGCGWPSFTQPLTESPLVEKSDLTHGMVRTEVRSKRADSHLGHVFDDGPKPTGLRYCINSASLRFVPVADLEKEGLGRFLPLFGQQAGAAAVTGAASTTPTTETAVLAGGCFWGMEDLLRKIPGVLETDCGYTGGHLDNPKYDDTHDSKSGHAEAVRIVFDPAKVSYDELLTWFFKIHDPTTLNRQGNDRGTQYRSAIFYASDAQKAAAERAIAAAELKWKKKIVTTLEPAAKWWPAEAYHQDYLVKNPRGYTCHYIRDL